jgi:hypothetical protein
MGRQTSPNPPEIFLKNQNDYRKEGEECMSMKNMKKFLVRDKNQNSEPIIGQFSYVALTQKMSSVVSPTSM